MSASTRRTLVQVAVSISREWRAVGRASDGRALSALTRRRRRRRRRRPVPVLCIGRVHAPSRHGAVAAGRPHSTTPLTPQNRRNFEPVHRQQSGRVNIACLKSL